MSSMMAMMAMADPWSSMAGCSGGCGGGWDAPQSWGDAWGGWGGWGAWKGGKGDLAGLAGPLGVGVRRRLE